MKSVPDIHIRKVESEHFSRGKRDENFVVNTHKTIFSRVGADVFMDDPNPLIFFKSDFHERERKIVNSI